MPWADDGAFALPLTPAQLDLALARGVGRAMLHARQHGLRAHEEVVVRACLRSRTRDIQLEGDLGGWLLRVARAGGVERAVRRAVLRSLSNPRVRHRDLAQRASIAGCLVEEGDGAARRALLRALDLHGASSYRVCVEVVTVLGEEGWRVFLRRIGSRPGAARSALGLHDWVVHAAEWTLGARRSRRILAEELLRDPRLAAFAAVADAALRDDPPPDPHGVKARQRRGFERALKRCRRRWNRVLTREQAFRRLSRAPTKALHDGTLEFLARSPRPKDVALVESWMASPCSDERAHDLSLHLVALGARGPTSPAWHPTLLRLWHRTPCRDCRGRIVSHLGRRGAAPRWLLREALHDAQRDTRAAARRALAPRRRRNRQR